MTSRHPAHSPLFPVPPPSLRVNVRAHLMSLMLRRGSVLARVHTGVCPATAMGCCENGPSGDSGASPGGNARCYTPCYELWSLHPDWQGAIKCKLSRCYPDAASDGPRQSIYASLQ